MHYRVIVVTTKNEGCCGNTAPINDEVEQSCNSMAAKGYVLINFWESRVQVCGGSKHAICLIFVRP